MSRRHGRPLGLANAGVLPIAASRPDGLSRRDLLVAEADLPTDSDRSV